jgi:hypothetical protein
MKTSQTPSLGSHTRLQQQLRRQIEYSRQDTGRQEEVECGPGDLSVKGLLELLIGEFGIVPIDRMDYLEMCGFMTPCH